MLSNGIEKLKAASFVPDGRTAKHPALHPHSAHEDRPFHSAPLGPVTHLCDSHANRCFFFQARFFSATILTSSDTYNTHLPRRLVRCPVPTSSRRAPSSPAMSRRASSSRASQTHSPNHSQSRRTSRVLTAARHRLSQSVRADDDDEEKSPIMIRDFAFPSADPRHIGLGPDVPPPCHPRRLARRLRPQSTSSNSSLDLPEDDGDQDGETEGAWGAGAFLGRLRLGGQAWTPSAAGVDGVGAADFARNFGDSSDEDEETDIRPGLYRAQYSFEPEDDAEMGLVEGQVVYVLGSAGSGGEEGGGAGWAVAVCREPVVVPSLPPSDDGGEEEPVLALSRLVGARTDAARVVGRVVGCRCCLAACTSHTDGAGEKSTCAR
ncbi:hypothetical protein FB45DRAFT_500399 [Roridomyces roridus]|uniref:SH3 domain-containing protein n=1 Tax=Roridomyces roridus TaxID=1738132 RepID=A0AAD7BVX0_9AGAR|nr:hypothetical protein FB45DRAFT_500399 [Roridomyces roridus]